MAKIQIKSEKLTPFGGIFSIMEKFDSMLSPLYLLFAGKGIVILNKYRNNLENFFRLRDNSNINKDLIIIAKLAGLSKKISFHTARHTNATLLIYNGVNITTVQKLLGHKSVKTTQVYTNIMDMTIVHDLEKIKQAALGIKKKTDNSFNK